MYTKRMTDCSPVVECEVDSLERSPAPRVLSDAEGLELLLGQAGGRSARQLVREAGQVRGHRGLPHTGVQLRGRGGGACRQYTVITHHHYSSNSCHLTR